MAADGLGTDPLASAPVVEGADDRSPLQRLIVRAQTVSEYKSTKHVQRELILEMAVAIVALAKLNADLLQQQADRPRIVLP